MKKLLIITTALICFYTASMAHAEPLADSVTLGSIPVGATIVIKKIGTNDFCVERGSHRVMFQKSWRDTGVTMLKKYGEIRINKAPSSDVCLFGNLSANQSIRLKIVSLSKERVLTGLAGPTIAKQEVTFTVTNHPLVIEIWFTTGNRDTVEATGEPIDLTVGNVRQLSEGMMDIELPGGNK